MKQLLIILLTLAIHFVSVDRSYGEVPNITLKCYLNLDFSANNTRNTDSEKILHFGLDKYFRAISILRISNLDDTKSKIVRFEILESGSGFNVSPTYPREISVIRSDDMSKLILTELYQGNEMMSHLIDQATLSLQLATEDSTFYTVCKILDYNTESLNTHIVNVIDDYYTVISRK